MPQNRPHLGTLSEVRWQWAWAAHLAFSGVFALTIFGLGLSTSLHAVMAWVAAACVWIGRRHWAPVGGRAWAWLTVSMLLAGVADLLWGLSLSGTDDGLAGGADAIYLVAFPATMVATWSLARSETAELVSTVDAGIALIGAGSIALFPVLRAALDDPASGVEGLIAALYPALALLVTGAALRTLLSSRARRPALALLVGAIAILVAADTVYAVQTLDGTYQRGVAEIGWLLSYGLIGAAALHPSMAMPARPGWARTNSLSGARVALLALSSFLPLVAHLLFGMPIVFTIALVGGLALVSVVRLAGPINAFRRTATMDPLTGLPNRLGVTAHLEDAIAVGGDHLAVLSCEIDRIKLVNDALGHAASDALFSELANRIVAAVPERTVVARMADDQLLVVVPGITTEQGVALGHDLIRRVADPVPVGEIEVRPTMWIGAASCSADEMPDSLIGRASAAVTRAKANGTGVATAPDHDVDALGRLQLASDLHAGLRSGHVVADFQPEVNFGDGDLFGFEALARWHDPQRGVVLPDAFIAAAEEAGLMGELFGAVLESALSEQHRWSAEVGHAVAVSVNISPVQLGAELVGQVRSALDRWQPERGSVWLELTESTVADLTDIVDVLSQIRALGVRLAIDDFGTGHSSLSRVAAFPWDAIKIDRSFVEGALHNRHARAVVESTIALGHALGVLTIAEGVESRHQHELLAALGCDVAQGYLLSPPVGAEEALGLAVRLTKPVRA